MRRNSFWHLGVFFLIVLLWGGGFVVGRSGNWAAFLLSVVPAGCIWALANNYRSAWKKQEMKLDRHTVTESMRCH